MRQTAWIIVLSVLLAIVLGMQIFDLSERDQQEIRDAMVDEAEATAKVKEEAEAPSRPGTLAAAVKALHDQVLETIQYQQATHEAYRNLIMAIANESKSWNRIEITIDRINNDLKTGKLKIVAKE